jgi:hypothetical protein
MWFRTVLLACFCAHASKCVIWGWNLLCFWMWHSVVVARHHCSGGVCVMFHHYILVCLKLCDLTSHNAVIFIAMKITSKSMDNLLVSWIAVYCCWKTIYTNYTTYIFMWGPLMVAQWLRYCATNRKVAGSSPDGVGIFHWRIPSDRTMALGLTQPPTEMSTRSISWG